MSGEMGESLRFIETETEDGQTIEVGEWTEEDGDWFLELDFLDLLEIAVEETEKVYIVKEEATWSYEVFFDKEKAREENSKGHWKERALHVADFIPAIEDG
jgi:hypothetical protein